MVRNRLAQWRLLVAFLVINRVIAVDDVDYCENIQCKNGASCTETTNSYVCECVAGFTGDMCETDVDECASNPCQKGGTCWNEHNGFKCDCLRDLYKGPTCDEAVLYTHFQYGPQQGVTSISRRTRDTTATGLIYTNGYVTFGLNFESRYPDNLNKDLLSYAKRVTAKKQGFAMLAPLWTDNDAQYGDIFYHVYDLTQPGSTSTDQARVKHAIDHAKQDVLNNGGVSVTDVTWVMVVTWTGMIPRLYYNTLYERPNTFQLVVAYDPSRYQTFTQYVYMDMGWDHEYLVRRSMIGHLSYKQEKHESLQLAPSMKSTAFTLDTRYGNTGDRGRYMFRVASGRNEVNYDQKCFNWFANEMRRISLVRYYWRWTMVCPCDLRLALMDGRWRFDWKQFYETRFERRCYYERMPWGMSTQECCYTEFGSLISTEDGRGGQAFFYHPRFERLHEKYDVLPKQWCCEFSDNCEYFYRVRPMDHCSGYTPLIIGWLYGDPHIRTLDGFQYTFNGLGEYTLIETTHGNFTLQGRTAKARDDNGKEMDATIFSAFAARDNNSDTFHVNMNATRNGLAIFIDGESVIAWFKAANDTAEHEYTNVILAKKSATEIEVTFTSGFSLTIGVNAEQLDITVGASDKFKNHTKGLMGVFNGDPTDDLLPPGENVVALSNSSSEKTIFYGFGELWRINQVDSLFYYVNGESYLTYAHPEFKPLFLEDVTANMTDAQKAKAKRICGDNKECIFDLAITGKEEAAKATLATNTKNEETASSLANGSPNITVHSVFNVTVGQENILTVTTSDPDGDVVIVSLNSTRPQGATWESNTYTWTPVDMEPVHISFKASDGKGGVAAADVIVNLCDCSVHGECLFDLLADGYELKQPFRIVQCNCSIGWEGDHCESDLDGCQDNPCTSGTDCIDLTPEVQVATVMSFSCSACPTGTEDKDGICLPINECDPANRRDDCEQICVDTPDSWTCECPGGYKLNDNGKNCTDIDECDEKTSGCEQECSNTKGSFVCSCITGYDLNADNKTCAIDDDECQQNRGGCNHICNNFDGGFNCSCDDGFQLMKDKKGCKPCPSGTWGKDCLRDCNCRDSDTACNVKTGCAECPDGFTGGDCRKDINECNVNDPCDGHSTCSNTIGTFKCVCHAGYTQYNATVCQDLDECESDPCMNGAECKDGDNSYTCRCLDGYTGTHCETEIDECANAPCKNKGICTDLINKYRCTCQRGYTGKNCQTEIAICDSHPCKNSGKCGQKNGDYFCDCTGGYTGVNCQSEIDECENNPCQNNGTCADKVNGFVCTCTDGYTGSLCETSVIDTVPVTETARFAVTVEITSETFSKELKDEDSTKYKEMKVKVVAAPVDKDSCRSVGWEFAEGCNGLKGSLVVNYEVKVRKSEASVVDDVVSAIKNSNGTFGEFDITSVGKTELKTVRFYGQFRVPGLTYTDSLKDNTTADYKTLRENVTDELNRIYKLHLGSKPVAVTDITFTPLFDFKGWQRRCRLFLWMDSSNADSNKLRNILVNQEDFKIKGFDVDRSSIRMSDFPWLPVVLGAVVSVVFVVLVVILVIFTVSKVRRAKLRRRRSFDDDQVSAPYSPTATKRNMLWQEGKPSMPPLDPGAIQRDRYERQRMGMVNRAMSKVAHIVSWSFVVLYHC
ncbi:hypothetical protein NP493_1501g01086 [Ridgeia piscesae]|uniref:Mucin-like protein n=1 Tax=Ridgeia piscesae TaxID=27915 RepID=A0AAD9K2P2_RIDPI|nr:hypothetical protein NP493_1501g01086 [Ridgeia piscesae]